VTSQGREAERPSPGVAGATACDLQAAANVSVRPNTHGGRFITPFLRRRDDFFPVIIL